jgi:hypothetical protein
MTAIPHKMICGRRRSKEHGIKKSKTASIFCLVRVEGPSTRPLYTPMPSRSSGFGKFTWIMSIRYLKSRTSPVYKHALLRLLLMLQTLMPTLRP